jgi:preprotein translocase subunit SecY
MAFLDKVLENLPEVRAPTQKRLSFKEKLKWTGLILVLYFILGMIPLFGLAPQNFQQFRVLEIVLGASFGSLITLGIGPIVTASIVLQLLNGAGLLKFDLSSHEGKARFQGVQKLLTFFFILLEGLIYVRVGGFTPEPGIPAWLIIFQLFLGGLIIMFMDEVVTKWGFGSGISLFIASGVSKELFVQGLSWLPPPTDPNGSPVGALPFMLHSLSSGNPTDAGIALAKIVATIAIFLIVVYAQAMKVEIPLSFGRIRGHGVRWPLNFFYTSNIPVILVAALLANLRLLGQFFPSMSWMEQLVSGQNVVQAVIAGSFGWTSLFSAITYIIIFVLGSLIFGIFWVQVAGLDAHSQARNIMNSGLQIPGFRKDQRVLERMLSRYIWPLTVVGSIAVGTLAAVADLTGVLGGSGTGILLTVMIVYQLYQQIAQQHMVDMNPMMRKFMGG